jgi:hypothetical protein
VTSALARSLLLADAVTRDALAQALLVCATRGTSLVRALVATRAIEPSRLELLLERGEAPMMRHIAPVMSLVEQLPPGLCERLLALPVRRDPRTGTIDVAVVDARDPHAVAEVAYWLKAPVRMVRTSLASMDAALKHIQREPESQGAGVRSLAPPIWVPSPSEPPRPRAETPVYGMPALVPHPPRPGDPVEAPVDHATERQEQPTTGLNIPFALKRKDASPVSLADLANRVGFDLPEPEADPVLDLRRRKSLAPQPRSLAPSGYAAEVHDVARLVEKIREAADRDAILELLAQGARLVAGRVAVLAVKREALAGWTCSPEMADRAQLRAARVTIAGSPVFGYALENSAARLARIPKDAVHAPLLAALRAPLTGEVALVPIRVDDKPVALVVADELRDADGALKRLEELAAAAGTALSALLRARRR